MLTRGRVGKHKVQEKTEERIVELGRGKYRGFNEHHLTEKLKQEEKIELSWVAPAVRTGGQGPGPGARLRSSTSSSSCMCRLHRPLAGGAAVPVSVHHTGRARASVCDAAASHAGLSARAIQITTRTTSSNKVPMPQTSFRLSRCWPPAPNRAGAPSVHPSRIM